MNLNDVIFDIDGTLADCSHRLHLVTKKPKNFDKFYELSKEDKPIQVIRDICTSMFWMGRFRHVLFVTGRPEKIRNDTFVWLKENVSHSLEPDNLFMRKDLDYRPDFVVKKEILDELRRLGYNPTVAFEDRDRNVEMYRNEGLVCLQVANGAY